MGTWGDNQKVWETGEIVKIVGIPEKTWVVQGRTITPGGALYTLREVFRGTYADATARDYRNGWIAEQRQVFGYEMRQVQA